MNKPEPAKTAETALEFDVAVIGGGPAGMMAAGRAAERAREEGRQIKVVILEKNVGLGKKLLITGGGRCNVTNAEFDDRALLAKFKDSAKFLFSTFSQYSVKGALEFFNSRDMPTKVENEKRVFPVSDSAKSVWDVLVRYLQDGDVTVLSKAQVTGFVVATSADAKSKHIEAIRLKDGRTIKAKSFILATGGTSHPETGSTGDGYAWLAELGHIVAGPKVSLVPVECEDAWVRKLSGFSLPHAKITLFQNGVKAAGRTATKKGKVLFTHFGLSGPAILNMSSEIGELMKYGDVIISLDLLPTHDYATLNEALQNLFRDQSNKKFKNALDALIPAPLIPAVLEKTNVSGDTFCHSITREERLLLIQVLKDMRIRPTGLLGADKAIITSGGVALSEIDWRTMRSRMVDNLAIVGDLLDIDRPSGGYSLQLCWTTSWVAGNSI